MHIGAAEPTNQPVRRVGWTDLVVPVADQQQRG